ncbi:MAG: hypothetical protein K0R75_2889 [Paenibacillaceae bacterium]|jgi:hypothetical protein|nr:hypothetical protein [Paenibacillaceae bacterium]
MTKQRWEYRITTERSSLAADGSDGWELVSVCVIGGVETFYMKRPCPSLREEITLSQRDNALAQRDNGLTHDKNALSKQDRVVQSRHGGSAG